MTKVVVGTRGTSGIPEFAGSTWVRLQYMLGLQRLGIESYWVDRLGEINPIKARRSIDYFVNRFNQMACRYGFEDRYCIIYNQGEKYFGLTGEKLRRLSREATLLLNVSGYLPDGSPLLQIPKRVFIDVDPGFTQIWKLSWDLDCQKHNFFLTIGQNVGNPEFTIPSHGIEWHHILPPVVLEQWPAMIDEACGSFTTIADWRASQAAKYENELYEAKRPEFLKILDLPRHTNQPLELALCVSLWDFKDIELLIQNGWHLENPYLRAGDPDSYRDYIRFSRAEFSVAKHGYVKSSSGWISDRTACYLSSGKPALVQSTGFEGKIPTGKGLLTFRTRDEAVAGIEEINRNYLAHCKAARQLAEQFFDSDIVLPKILEKVGFH
ncbi:MAG: hypothetical protein JW715_16465 [Sedimentisphaerales bacterium]|nr:hypothetical protein [Sedimentisphaerales bacterium]